MRVDAADSIKHPKAYRVDVNHNSGHLGKCQQHCNRKTGKLVFDTLAAHQILQSGVRINNRAYDHYKQESLLQDSKQHTDATD